MSTQYKPSPLSYGSPRASPFRRPESPASPSPLRQSTPNHSPTKMATTATTPSRLAHSSTPTTTTTTDADTWTPRGLTPTQREPEASPTRRSNASSAHGEMRSSSARPINDNNALSKLQPTQVRELREGFQILDRDSDGHVGREDVADTLNQLGLSSSSADIAPFFPPSTPQTISLPVFLNSLAGLLASLSPSSELLSAFSAFDDDDSGQVDLAELRNALLHTAPEPGEKPLTEREVDKVMNGFTGRRAFGKHTGGGMGKRGKYLSIRNLLLVLLVALVLGVKESRARISLIGRLE